jgi:hypothetical protein
MSHVTITCPCCEVTGRVRKKYAGRNVRCRHCRHAFRMPPWDDCVARMLRCTAKTILTKVKSATQVKGGSKAGEVRKLILLREQGMITQSEFEELRRKLRR